MTDEDSLADLLDRYDGHEGIELTAVASEVERRLRADFGGSWNYSTRTNRIVKEAVDQGLLAAMSNWRDYKEDPAGPRNFTRRATDRAKRWLYKENERQWSERAAGDMLALAAAVSGYKGAVTWRSGPDVPLLVRFELDQLRRLVDALDKPHRAVIEARYWLGEEERNMTWPDVAAVSVPWRGGILRTALPLP